MKVVRHSFKSYDKTLHVEADGCVVNIRVGLWDDDGHRIIRVTVIPEYTPDLGGGTWKTVEGVTAIRVVRTPAGEVPPSSPDLHRILEVAAADRHYTDSVYCREHRGPADKVRRCVRCDAETFLAEGW